jgi:hypothetical protein
MTAFEEGVQTITYKFVDIILTPIEWLLIGASLIMFFYGLVMFMVNSDSNQKEEGKKHML